MAFDPNPPAVRFELAKNDLYEARVYLLEVEIEGMPNRAISE